MARSKKAPSGPQRGPLKPAVPGVPPNSWPQKVHRLVQERGISYRKLEQLAGWPDSTLRAAMKRHSALTIGKAKSLARALKVPMDWLFDQSATWDERPETYASDARLRDYIDVLTRAFAEMLAQIADSKVTANALLPYILKISRALDAGTRFGNVQRWGYRYCLYDALGAAMDPEGKEEVLPGDGAGNKTWQAAFHVALDCLADDAKPLFPDKDESRVE